MTENETSECMKHFESFGANCEFGFVHERCSVNIASLFRWAEILSIGALTKLVKSEFSDVYEFENLVPFNAGMVLDRSVNVAWHSVMRSKLIDAQKSPIPENFEFLESDKDRRIKWETEIQKVNSLKDRTLKALRTGKRIYVYKPIKKDLVTAAELDELHAAVNAYNRNIVLFVNTEQDDRRSGTVTLSKAGWMHGTVDRFAPGSNARDISLESWTAVCKSAFEISKDILEI